LGREIQPVVLNLSASNQDTLLARRRARFTPLRKTGFAGYRAASGVPRLELILPADGRAQLADSGRTITQIELQRLAKPEPRKTALRPDFDGSEMLIWQQRFLATRMRLASEKMLRAYTTPPIAMVPDGAYPGAGYATILPPGLPRLHERWHGRQLLCR